jgi:membrane protease YdiL (CAAX protease family)
MSDDPPQRRAQVQLRAPVSEFAAPVPCARSAPVGKFQLRDFVLYCGAGVFEEFVFRALLLGLLLLVLTKLFYMEHAWAAAWSVLLGAAIFSAFHHLGGEKFESSVFTQRVIAGIYFSALFYNRSFGVAAASHALYDIVVGLNQLRQ